MNKLLISTLLLAAAVTARAESTIVDELVVTGVPRKPVLSQDVIADVRMAPSDIVPRIELPPLKLTPPAPVPEHG